MIKKFTNIFIFLGFSIFIMAIYMLTSSPEIGWIDSGIIAAAAKTLGIPNPPGFPAYILVAHIFTSIPWFSAVFTLKLLSQLAALGISAGVFWLTWHIAPKNRKFFSATVASLCLSFSYNLWSQANNIETYTLTNLALLLFFIWLVWANERSFKSWQLLLVGLLGGISLGLNPMIVCIAPAVMWWVYQNKKTIFRHSPVVFILTLLSIMVGATIIYSYLPLRASTHPFINWGDPVNFERIKTHLFGAGLNIYEPETNSINGFTWQPSIFLKSFLHYLQLAIFQFTPLLFPLVLWGGFQLWQKNRSIFALTIAVILGNLLFVVLYYGGNQESWMLTSWMMMAIYLGYAVANLPDIYYKPWLLAIPLIPLFFWFPLLNHSQDTYATDYAKILYREVPPNSVIIGGGDFFNSLTAYTHEVTGERKDVIPVTGNMFYIFPWYRENLRQNTNLIISQEVEDAIKFKNVDEFTNAIDQLVSDNPNRTFFVTPLLLRDSIVAGTKDGTYHTSKYNLIPHGLLLQVVPKESFPSPAETLYSFPSMTKTPFYLERNYTNAFKLLQSDYAVAYAQLGDYYLGQNNLQLAEQSFQKAVMQDSLSSSEFTQRLAIYYAQSGQNDLANKLFTQSLSRDPDNETIMQNFQTFLSQTASSSAQPVGSPSAQLAGGTFKSKSGLEFAHPPGWAVSEKDGQISVSDPTSNFSIHISQDLRAPNVTIENYLANQKPSSDQVLEQGMAQIPGTDLAYVKVLKFGDTTQLDFSLFKANIVIHILVGPADSPNMKVFDSLVTSLKL